MARGPQSRSRLTEDDIPDDLKGLPRKCPREGCRSDQVALRYFNNRKVRQPRYICQACKEHFTLGGGLYNKQRTGKCSRARVAGRKAARLNLVSRPSSRTTSTQPVLPPAACTVSFDASKQADASSSYVDEAPVLSSGSPRLYQLVKLPVVRTDRSQDSLTDDEDKRMDEMHAASTRRLHEIRQERLVSSEITLRR